MIRVVRLGHACMYEHMHTHTHTKPRTQALTIMIRVVRLGDDHLHVLTDQIRAALVAKHLCRFRVGKLVKEYNINIYRIFMWLNHEYYE